MRKNGRSAVCFIWLGIAIVVIPFLLRMRQGQDTQMYVKEFEEEEHEEKTDKNTNRNTDKKKDSLLLKEGFIGIIEIPDLNIKYPIFEGTGNTQLNEGIGHMTETAGLCGKGNCVLAGHNGSRRGVYFTYLSNIEAGTRVKITNKKRVTHEYMAQEMRVVSPYDEWVTEESEDEILTLFTCASHGTRRFAVKCIPVTEGGDADGQPVQAGRECVLCRPERTE